MAKYPNLSNPAAFGTEWTVETTRYQLVNPRGTTSLYMGMRSADSAEWATVPVVDPERFGLTKPPKSFAEFLKVVHAFADPYM